MYFLPHSRPQCTGEWKILAYSGHVLWRCAGCRATFPECTWVREAAARENWSGTQMQRLTWCLSIDGVSVARERQPEALIAAAEDWLAGPRPRPRRRTSPSDSLP